MTDQFDENKPLYGSRGIAIHLLLLKSRYSHVNIDELLRYSQMEPYQVTDDGHLFSQKQINLFHEKIVELTGNKHISREAGPFASSQEALGTMKGSVIGLLGPIRYYELIGTLANKISKSSHYAARKLAHNKVEVIVTPNLGTVEQPFQCENRMGYRLKEAACGEEALEVCKNSKEKIDLLLADVIMPGINGRELSEIIQKECPGIKIVLMSGYSDNVVGEHDVLKPGIAFLNKPLLPVAMANTIRSVLDSDGKKQLLLNSS